MPKPKLCQFCFYWQGERQAQVSECFSSRAMVACDNACGEFIPMAEVAPAPASDGPTNWLRKD